ncbi:MAG: hypothetical protein DRH37_05370 [Deltaproteobacteria bacterium]|nr:MAG: hypothetical protein B5M55_03820 [Desulfococcus sp. 4484_242]RLC30443.1 MAG: hypothetical protein DRH37_05370 [Deltaproteobacteria bacterium]
MNRKSRELRLNPGDALIVVDLQNDFLPGGALAVRHSSEIIPVINRYIALFQSKGLPVYATRDWHPKDHCSFETHGGPWPPHCIQDTPGSRFPSELRLPASVVVISKAAEREKDAYSGFEGTDLAERLRAAETRRLLIGGLATEYCVFNTVKDALRNGFSVLLLLDAVRAVNVNPDDGKKAVQEMIRLGAQPVEFADIQKAESGGESTLRGR